MLLVIVPIAIIIIFIIFISIDVWILRIVFGSKNKQLESLSSCPNCGNRDWQYENRRCEICNSRFLGSIFVFPFERNWILGFLSICLILTIIVGILLPRAVGLLIPPELMTLFDQEPPPTIIITETLEPTPTIIVTPDLTASTLELEETIEVTQVVVPSATPTSIPTPEPLPAIELSECTVQTNTTAQGRTPQILPNPDTESGDSLATISSVGTFVSGGLVGETGEIWFRVNREVQDVGNVEGWVLGSLVRLSGDCSILSLWEVGRFGSPIQTSEPFAMNETMLSTETGELQLMEETIFVFGEYTQFILQVNENMTLDLACEGDCNTWVGTQEQMQLRPQNAQGFVFTPNSSGFYLIRIQNNQPNRTQNTIAYGLSIAN